MGMIYFSEDYIEDIADAIRARNGQQTEYMVTEMPAAIASLPNEYTQSDEGKVVSNGALVAQGSDTVTENGTVDTTLISSLIVNVSGGGGGSVMEVTETPDVSDMENGDVQILVTRENQTNVKPTCAVPTAGIAGQNSSNALAALNYNGTLNNNYAWTTADRNYSNLWVGADYGEPIVLNSVAVAPRTWARNRQIYTVIMEASNDLSEWITIGTAPSVGNELRENMWYVYTFSNSEAYRYYRLRTETNASGTVNGSVTFTLQGLGFLYISESQLIPTKAFYKKGGVLYSFER